MSKTLRKLRGTGTTPVQPVSLSEDMLLTYLDQDALSSGFEESKKKIQHKKSELELRRQRHEQRRRKFVRQVDTAQINISRQYFENEVIGRLLEVSACEKQENDLHKEVTAFKDVILLNRRNRDRRCDEINEVEAIHNSAWENVEAKREYQWNSFLDTNSQLRRRDVLQNATKHANQKDESIMVTDFLAKICDAVDWVLTYREMTGLSDERSTYDFDENAVPIPELIWQDVKKMIVEDGPFLAPLPNMQPALPSSLLLPFSISERPLLADRNWLAENTFSGAYTLDNKSEAEASCSEILARADWNQLMNELLTTTATSAEGIAKAPALVDAENVVGVTVRTKDAVYTPPWLLTVDPALVLSEAIIAIRTTLQPIPPEPSPVLDTSHIAMRVALVGESTTKRQSMVKALQTLIPRLVVISTEAMVTAALSVSIESNSSVVSEVEIAKRQLQERVLQCLQSGQAISDELYIALILNAILSIPTPNNGYILSDFPNTQEQLLSLMEAMSGIRYDAHRPQPADYLSSIAALDSVVHLSFSPGSCGLDAVVCTDVMDDGIDLILHERLNARRNLVTGELIFLDEKTSSVKGCKQLQDPTRPLCTLGLDTTVAKEEVKVIQRLCTTMGLLETVNYEGYQSSEEQQAIEEKARALRDRFIPSERWEEEFWTASDEAKAVDAMAEQAVTLAEAPQLEEAFNEMVDRIEVELTPKEAEETANETAPAPMAAAAIEPIAGDEESATIEPAAASTKPARVVLYEENKLSKDLATLLNQQWSLAEGYAAENGRDFFSALQDVRYQALQRNRIAQDIILTCIMRFDGRQELFDTYRDAFNTVPDDMRFDPDTCNELHLRTLDLRNHLSKKAEQRLREAEHCLKTLKEDGAVIAFHYRVKCEAAVLLQLELNRFFAALQVIFDYTKAVQGFDCHLRIKNELEPLLPSEDTSSSPVSPPAKDGKDAKKDAAKDTTKGKKDAGPAGPFGNFAAYREAVAPVLVQPTTMADSIPVPENKDEVVDPKAAKKAAAKPKKGQEETGPYEPFQEALKAVTEEVNKWKQSGSFAVSRELYYNVDEALCQVIERAIWFEASKLETSFTLIERIMNEHITWLDKNEQELLLLLQRMCQDRFNREMFSGEMVIKLAEECIAGAIPMHSLWLVSNDAAAPIKPEEAWEKFKKHLPASLLAKYETPEGLEFHHRHHIKSAGSNRPQQSLEVSLDDSLGSASGRSTVRTPSRSQRAEPDLGYALRVKSPSMKASAIHDEVVARSRERYEKQRLDLEQRMHQIRTLREDEFVGMGMSASSAKLAAFNDLLLEEQHQLSDLESQFKPRRAVTPGGMRPHSSKSSRGLTTP